MKKQMVLLSFISSIVLLSFSYSHSLYAKEDGVVILQQTISKNEFAKDGKTVILTVDYSYPEIQNLDNIEAIHKVNKDIAEFANKRLDINYSNGLEYATEFVSNISSGQKGEVIHFLPYTIDLIYDIGLKRNNIISILYADSTWFGGAHPNTEWKSATYHLGTGEELKATDILVWNENEIKQFIAKEFEKKAKLNPYEFFENDIMELKNLKFDYSFWLTKEGMEFYFNPYEIAPYVAGRVSVTLPYKSNENVFRKEILNYMNQ